MAKMPYSPELSARLDREDAEEAANPNSTKRIRLRPGGIPAEEWAAWEASNGR